MKTQSATLIIPFSPSNQAQMKQGITKYILQLQGENMLGFRSVNSYLYSIARFKFTLFTSKTELG